MNVLSYDFETTGLPLWSEPSDHEDQPHIVQLGAILADSETGRVLHRAELIAKPDGWEIPDETAEIHGITTEHALAVGVPEVFLIQTLFVLWEHAALRIGYNESFDARIMRIALKRYFGDQSISDLDERPPADVWKDGKAECVMRLATPMVNLPPSEKMRAAKSRRPKPPKLTEAYQHFFGVVFDGAHSALADAQAALDVWRHIKGEEVVKVEVSPSPKDIAAKIPDDGLSFL